MYKKGVNQIYLTFMDYIRTFKGYKNYHNGISTWRINLLMGYHINFNYDRFYKKYVI